jgi:hypothetical protein
MPSEPPRPQTRRRTTVPRGAVAALASQRHVQARCRASHSMPRVHGGASAAPGAVTAATRTVRFTRRWARAARYVPRGSRMMVGARAQAVGGLWPGAFATSPIAQNLETRAPFRSVLGGPGAWRSNTPGTAQGLFGWGNIATGLVNNTRVADSDAQGIVIPFRNFNMANGGVVGGPPSLGGWQASYTWEFQDGPYLRVRPGLVVTMHDRGNFFLRFAGGAIYGAQVFASLSDGSAISGAAAGAELTPFLVVGGCAPGGLGIVSSSAFFTP